MLTPFGIAIRKLRLDRGMRLLDLADLLGQSPAYLSAVETGKKPIPEEYPALVAEAMKLTANETLDLRAAADQSRSIVRVDRLSGDQRELVAEFARKVDTLGDDVLADLRRRIIHRSVASEIPFRRKRRGLLVGSASLNSIWCFAEKVRQVFVDASQVEFPIMEVIEFKLSTFFPGYYLDVCDEDEMGDDGGRVIAGQNCIKLRNDVYEGACRGNGWHRFTASHEFAHFLLHREVVFARTCSDDQPVYRDAEWQADSFAGSLLMSSRHVNQFSCERDAAQQCGMTPAAARVMFCKYQKGGKM